MVQVEPYLHLQAAVGAYNMLGSFISAWARNLKELSTNEANAHEDFLSHKQPGLQYQESQETPQTMVLPYQALREMPVIGGMIKSGEDFFQPPTKTMAAFSVQPTDYDSSKSQQNINTMGNYLNYLDHRGGY